MIQIIADSLDDLVSMTDYNLVIKYDRAWAVEHKHYFDELGTQLFHSKSKSKFTSAVISTVYVFFIRFRSVKCNILNAGNMFKLIVVKRGWGDW